MKLTGDCKKEFEKWYFKNHVQTTKKFKELYPHEYKDIFGWFYGISASFKYGVYVDYFDSIKIHVDIHPLLDYNNEAYTNVISYIIIVIELNKKEELNREDLEVKTRPEARSQAILKANEIRNEQLKQKLLNTPK